MGPPGAGKTQTWKQLGRAQDKTGKKTTIVDLNPKTDLISLQDESLFFLFDRISHTFELHRVH